MIWKAMIITGLIGLIATGLLIFRLYANTPSTEAVVWEIFAIKCKGPGATVTLNVDWWPVNYDREANVLYVMRRVEPQQGQEQ